MESIVLDIELDTDEAIRNAAELRTRIAALKDEQKELKKVGEEGSTTFAKNAVEIKNLSGELRGQEKQLTTQNQLMSANNGSIEQLRSALSILTAQYNSLSEEERESTEIGQRLASQIKETSDELKELEGNVGNTSRNVGNYEEAIEKATKENKGFSGSLKSTGDQMGALPGPTGAAVSGFRGLVTTAKAFIATPIGAIIAALALALGAVTSWFKRSAEGQEQWNKILTVSEAILGTVLDYVGDLGEAIFNAFQNPKETLKEFGNAIKDFVLDRVEALVDGLGFAGSAIKKLFKGDFEGAFDDAKDAAKKIFIEANPVIAAGTKLVKGLADTAKEAIKEAVKDAKDANELAERQNALRRREIEALKQRANLESEIAEQRLIAQDKEKFTAEERLKAAKQALTLNQQLAGLDRGLAEERLALKQLENSINDSTLEDLEKEAQLEADLIRIRKQSADSSRELLERITSTSNELDAIAQKKADAARKLAEEALDAQKEAAERMREDIVSEYDHLLLDLKNKLVEGKISEEEYEKEIQDLKLASLLAQREFLQTQKEKEIEDLQAYHDHTLQMLKDRLEAGEITEREYLERSRELNKDVETKQADANREIGEEKLDIDNRVADARLEIKERELGEQKEIQKKDIAEISRGLDEIAGLFGEQTAAYKAIRIAQTTLDTFSSATAAFNSLAGIPYVGPVLGAAAAAAAIADGIANVKKIQETPVKFATGGLIGVGGKSHADGGTKFYGEDGSVFEAEKGEVIAVVNKNSRGLLNQLSDINVQGGGANFYGSGAKSYLADGGFAARAASRPVREQINQVQNLSKLTVITKISDIERVSAHRDYINKLTEL